jgi:hypothetical protein
VLGIHKLPGVSYVYVRDHLDPVSKPL